MNALTDNASSLIYAEQLRSLARTTAPLIINISRKAVESGDIDALLERLTLLSDSTRFVAAFANRIVIVFTGYESDARPVHQIPGCSRFFRHLTMQWPYWFSFISKTPEQFTLLFQLLCDVDVGRAANISTYTYFKNMEAVRETWFSLFMELSQLYKRHGMTTVHLPNMSAKVVNAYNAMIGN